MLSYGMGLNPLTATAADLPHLARSQGGPWKFVFRRAKGLSDVVLSVEGSGTLQSNSWSAPTILDQSVTDHGTHESVEVSIQPPAGSRYFLRLKAETR